MKDILKFNKEAIIDVALQVGTFLLVLLAFFIVAKLIKRMMAKKETVIGIDNTRYIFLSHFISGMLYFTGLLVALYSIPSLRGVAASIFASSSLLAIVIGFASQQAFANIVGGMFIAIFKPFRLGDRLRFVGKDFIGIVEDITLRHTVIRTFDNKRIIVPNSVISSEILENSNIVDEKILKMLDIGISYDSDIDKAMSIIKEEALKHPEFLDNRNEDQKNKGEEPVPVRLLEFGDSALILRAWIWTNNPSAAFIMGCDLNKSIKARFDKEGIEIPFPHRTVLFKDPTINQLNTDQSHER